MEHSDPNNGIDNTQTCLDNKCIPSTEQARVNMLSTNGNQLKTTVSDKKSTRKRLSRYSQSLQTLAQKNKELKMKVQSSIKTTSSTSNDHLEASSSKCIKREFSEDNETDDNEKTKRQRQRFQPFQSPNCLTSTPLLYSKLKDKDKEKDKEKVVIYNYGDYLAVRNESNSFFMCRAKQNIYLHGRKIKIQWYNNDADPEAFVADFHDSIDFECILTNIRVDKVDKNNIVSLPNEERQRIMNILERAINIGKGINEPFDPTKVLSDGLDISILDKEKEIMKNMKNGKKNVNENLIVQKQNINLNQGIVDNSETENSDNNIEETVKEEFVKPKRIKVLRTTRGRRKPKWVNSPTTSISNNNCNKKNVVEKLITPSSRSKSRKISPMNLNIDAGSPQNDITTIKFDNYSKSDTSSDDQTQEKDLMFNSRVELPSVSTYVNSKLLIRAVLLNDSVQLINQLQQNSNSICSVTIPRSLCNKWDALNYAIDCEDIISFNHLVKATNLADYPQYIHSIEMFHSELLLDEASYQLKINEGLLNSSYAKFAIKNNISHHFIKKIQSHFINKLNDFTSNIMVAVKHGHYDLFYFLAQEICNSDSTIFNKSHLKLFDQTSCEPNLSILSEYTLPDFKMYPLHIAAINPDPNLFYSIANNSLDKLYSTDYEGWMPMHYASVCSTFFNLQFLLNLGVSTSTFDSKGNTPLHLATKCNRFENVALILNSELSHSSTSISLRSYNQKGWTPLHIACKKGLTNMIRFFLENKADVNIVSSSNSGELTPLMIASQYGHLKLVELLIENGANVNCLDKKNRNPLTHAVMNGHSSIVNCLLNHSANASCKDIFGNNLFHYALAYGWYFCYEIILKATVNLKDTNTFGLTPICAAFMKGHIGIIEDIFRRNILGVNVPVNDLGVNLVMLTFSLYPDNRMLSILKLFIEKYKCDFAKTDYNGNNAFHYLLHCEAKHKSHNSLKIDEILIESFTLLLKNGCDPFHSNNAGICPILFALKNDCFTIFKLLFRDHNRLARFQQIVAGNELLWPIIISHLLEPIESTINNTISFARYMVNILNQNKNFHHLLKNLIFKTNKNGELPVEYFIKSSRRIVSQSKAFSFDVINHDLSDFTEMMLNFYDLSFIQNISLLNMAAEYSSPTVINILSTRCLLNESSKDGKNNPLAIAIRKNMIENAKSLIKCGSKPDIQICGLSCFMYYLKHCKSFELVFELTRCWSNPKETDLDSNTALHLACANIENDQCYDLIRFLIEKGVDINSQNKFGKTALHIAFDSNSITKKLCNIFDILLQKGINLYLRDNHGFIALNYLFKRNADENIIISIIQMIDTKKYELNSFLDNNGSNLLHCCVKTGNVASLAFFKSLIDINKPNNEGITPLILASINQDKESVMVLLRSDVDLFKNHFFDNDDGKRKNLFSVILNNGWMDILYEMLEVAKSSNRLLEFTNQLIQSRCLELAIMAFKIMSNRSSLSTNDLKGLLIEFSKFSTNEISNEKQVEFFKLFDMELIHETITEMFLNALTNWNDILCEQLLKMIRLDDLVLLLQKERINKNMISIVFHNLFHKKESLTVKMKNLIIGFLDEEYSFDSLSFYPIMENGQTSNRYSTIEDHTFKNKIQYSPLIVAIIAGKHDIVKWMLSIKHNGKYAVNVNFADSNQRTPIMHAILNNDLKMIKLLMDRNYCYDEDKTCWLDIKSTFTNRNDVDLLARDKNMYTLFHYLILPFEYFNYSKSDLLFNFLWQMLDDIYKTQDFISELYKMSVDNHVLNISNLLKNLEQQIIACHPIAKKSVNVKKSIYNFVNDYDEHLNQCSRVQKYTYSSRNILHDEIQRMPYDVTFTKLDSQFGKCCYNYNFYKMQITSVVNKYILTIRYGRVGTVGNIKKTYYESKQEIIEEFERIFFLKSGNKWCVDQFKLNEDKYRVVGTHKRNLKLVTFDLDINLDQLVTIKSELSIDLRDLIIRWITCEMKHIETCAEYEMLNSSILDNCCGILEQIYSHIDKHKIPSNTNKKRSLKYMNDIIDLSEEFYNQIGIYGKEFDSLKPIMNLSEYLEKIRHIHQLKGSIFSKELLYCAQKMKDLNPVDYVYDSFCYELENVPIESEEWKFVHLYLKNSIEFNFKTITFYRVKHYGDQLDSRNSYLLWYRLHSNSIIQTFSKGLQLEPTCDRNSNLVYKSITLTNKITGYNREESDQLIYLLLCEAKLDNILEVEFDEPINRQLIENKDAIVIKDETITNMDYFQKYLSWKGFTVPFRCNDSNGPTEFQILNPKHIIPKYLIEFKPT